MTNIKDLGEFGLIKQMAKGLKMSPDVIKGIGDDAAVLNVDAKKRLLLTTDMLVENVHFTQKMSAKDIGFKAIACNISDIAAMGGIPKFAVVSIGLPSKTDAKWVKNFYAGMESCARKFGVSIVGGDTVKSDQIVINVALTGEADPKLVILRSGAKPGDVIFVTGKLGNSLKSGRHLKPNPRVSEAQYLVKNFKINAMMDISDGLAADLGHILEESRVGAVLDAEAIPLYADAKLDNALYDGEDYELVFTMGDREAKILMSQLPLPPLNLKRGSKKLRATIPPLVFKEGVRGRSVFYPIGVITKEPRSLNIRYSSGRIMEIKPKGYKHF